MYKEQFIGLLKQVDREGIDDLIKYLESTDFFEAPASSKYHNNYAGGLVEHSLNVYKELMIQRNATRHNFDIDSIILVSLLHDICKINTYKLGKRNVKNDKDKWISVPYYEMNEDFIYGHAVKSIFIARTYIKLKKSEIMAIRYHMGAYEGFKDYSGINKTFRENPLALHLHIADVIATSKEVII